MAAVHHPRADGGGRCGQGKGWPATDVAPRNGARGFDGRMGHGAEKCATRPATTTVHAGGPDVVTGRTTLHRQLGELFVQLGLDRLWEQPCAGRRLHAAALEEHGNFGGVVMGIGVEMQAHYRDRTIGRMAGVSWQEQCLWREVSTTNQANGSTGTGTAFGVGESGLTREPEWARPARRSERSQPSEHRVENGIGRFARAVTAFVHKTPHEGAKSVAGTGELGRPTA